jgi:hypothetical protein
VVPAPVATTINGSRSSASVPVTSTVVNDQAPEQNGPS